MIYSLTKMSLTDIATTVLGSVFGSWSSILLLVVVLLATWMYYSNPARHSPPGPTYLPLIGSVPFLFGPDIGDGKCSMELSRKYKSPIVSMRTCGVLMTVINDYDLMKEVFAKRADVMDRNTAFSGMYDCMDNFQRKTAGLITESGHDWKVHRHFTMQLMREFGMGKLSGEDNVVFEAEEAMQAFKQQNGKPFDPRHIIAMAVANIINQFIYGKRFSYTDKNFLTTLNCMNEFARVFGSPITFLLLFRLGRLLLKSQYEHLLEVYRGMTHHVRIEIEEHKARFDGSANDMIDAYLVQMKTNKNNEDFTAVKLVHLISDMFGAGSETTSTTLRWALLEMAVHQDVQEKVYQELNNVLGPDKYPSMTTKKDTPYTEAVLSEIQRCHTLLELGAPRANISQDIEINGYIIPRDTMVNVNLFAIHNDQKFWKKPDEFYPENFLDNQGNITNLDKLFPFSIGRRSCAGEALARTELYILFATWMKYLHVKLEADDTVPDMRPTGSTMRQPHPFSVRLYSRPPPLLEETSFHPAEPRRETHV